MTVAPSSTTMAFSTSSLRSAPQCSHGTGRPPPKGRSERRRPADRAEEGAVCGPEDRVARPTGGLGGVRWPLGTGEGLTGAPAAVQRCVWTTWGRSPGSAVTRAASTSGLAADTEVCVTLQSSRPSSRAWVAFGPSRGSISRRTVRFAILWIPRGRPHPRQGSIVITLCLSLSGETYPPGPLKEGARGGFGISWQ